MNEIDSEEHETTTNCSSLTDPFHTNIDPYKISHWDECPSFFNSEERFRDKIFETIGISRCAAFMRLSTLMPQDIFARSHRKAFLSPSSLNIVPLFRTVSASVIQAVTNLCQRFFVEPQKIAKYIIDYFNKNPTFSDLFSTVSFPGIFFYFMTSEFSEIGAIFIESCLAIVHDRFTANLLASYFDCFPRFSETLWLTFEKNCQFKRLSVFSSFLEAIKTAFRQLTPNHSRLIHFLNETDPKFLSDFFFRRYFQPRAHMKYYTASGDRYLTVLLELMAILKFAASNYGSPHQVILLNAILSAESLSTKELSYSDDIQLPTVYALLSGAEIALFRDLLLQSDLIKFKTALQEAQLSKEKALSMTPGYVQYSAKPILTRSKRSQLSLIFEYSKTTKAEEDPDLERIYLQLNKIASDRGQTILSLITKSPQTAEVKSIVLSPTVKSEKFQNFVYDKLKNIVKNSERCFEIFVARLQTKRELSRISDDCKRDSQMYMWKNAQEFVLNRCILQGKFSAENKKTVVSQNTQFLSTRYRESLLANHHKFKEEQITPFYPTQNKMKSPKFEDLLKVIKVQDNIDQFTYHFVLALLNEWPNEPNITKEIIDRFSTFSDQKRCNLCENPKIIEMIAKNVFVMKVFEKMKKLSDLKLGNQIAELVQITQQLKLVYDWFYSKSITNNKNNANNENINQNLNENLYGNVNVNNNCIDNGDFISFSEFACDCFILAGVDELIISFIWFARLAANFRPYLAAVNSDLIDVFVSVTAKMFNIVHDRELSILLKKSVLLIPESA